MSQRLFAAVTGVSIAMSGLAMSVVPSATATEDPAGTVSATRHNSVEGDRCGRQGKLRVVKHSPILHAKYRCEKVAGDAKPHPVWNPESDPVRAGKLLVSGVQGSPADPANCQSAYDRHSNTHNICASAFNLAPTFNTPGALNTSSVDMQLQRWWGAGDWDGHWADAASMGNMGTSTWGFSSARVSYNAYQEADWKVVTPAETVGFKAEQGDSDPNGATNQASCYGGLYTGCDLDKDFGVRISGDQVGRIKVYYRNAPITVVINNNTNAPLKWRSVPDFSGISVDPRGSTERYIGQKPVPVTTGSADAYYIGGYRAVDGSASSLDFQLSFPDTNYRTNKVTHVVDVVGQLAPDNAGAQLRAWKTDTKGSTCEDNPTGGDAGLTATCSVTWGGTASWTSSATMVVTINNR